jgi:hypothetical protein
MTERPIKIPGPDHPITVTPNPKRVVVTLGGKTVADTRDALTLKEASYPAVQYIPRKDVDMALLARTDHATYCPYKARRRISASRRAASGRSTRSGPMSRPIRRLRRSRITWRFIRTGWTGSSKRIEGP